MADIRKDPNVAINDKRFTSDYGYSKDVTNSDIPGFTQTNNSALHDTVSLNDTDRESGKVADPNLFSNTFKVTSKNSTLGLNNLPKSTLTHNGGISKLYGSTPSSTYSDRTDLV